MSAVLAPSTAELSLGPHRLCERLQPGWHPYVALIAACGQDFEDALALAGEHPDALDLDDILPALEALRLLLVSLSHTTAA
jgi:hypothetical protein